MLNWLTLFLAGIMTYLTPCVLPLVPIYLAALGGSDVSRVSEVRRRTLVLRAACFGVGFTAVFVAMGLAASQVGGALHAHRHTVQTVGGGIIVLFGLKYLGIIDIPWLDRILRSSHAGAGSRFAAFNAIAMGALFGAGWSPCVGPILGTVLTYTASAGADAVRGAAYLATYSAGLAVPLILTAWFVQPALQFLRRLRPHLRTMERLTGVALLLAGGWLLRTASSIPAESPMAMHVAAIPRMVELYSRDCTVCQQMVPVVKQVEDECSGAVQVERVDISAASHRAMVNQYRLVGVPTFLFMDKDGAEVARLIGRQSPEALRQAMAALRGEECPGVEPIVPQTPITVPPHACAVDEDGQVPECG